MVCLGGRDKDGLGAGVKVNWGATGRKYNGGAEFGAVCRVWGCGHGIVPGRQEGGGEEECLTGSGCWLDAESSPELGNYVSGLWLGDLRSGQLRRRTAICLSVWFFLNKM